MCAGQKSRLCEMETKLYEVQVRRIMHQSEKCMMLKSQYSAYTIMLASHGRTFSKVTFYLLWAVMVRLRHCLLSVNISFTF